MRRLTLLPLVLLAGCTSAVSSGHNTALDSVDLVQMTDQMARSLAAESRVQLPNSFLPAANSSV